MSDMDDVLKDMKAFEFEGASVLTPRDYAQLRGVSPQRVYYFIKRGKLPFETCNCGRKVVNVQQADDCFRTFARLTPHGLDGQGEGSDVVSSLQEVSPPVQD